MPSTYVTRFRARKPIISIGACLVLGLASCCAGQPDRSPPKTVALSVYTQNLFIGADLLNLGRLRFNRSSLREIWNRAERESDRIMRTIHDHDFFARADGVARQIARDRPDVIALQEVTLIRKRGFGGHWIWINLAQSVEYDYLEILMEKLRERGLSYKVAAVSENFDEEVPSDEYGYLRFTDRDAILVRSDIDIISSSNRKFDAQWRRGLYIRNLELTKGYQELILEKQGRRFQVVNVHLERLEDFKTAQNQELFDRYGQPDLPTIIAGDFNAGPGSGLSRIWRETYRDVWSTARGGGGGTCCYRIPLWRGGRPTARWDWILASRLFEIPRGERGARLIHGRVKSQKNSLRLQLSDHAGVLARLRLP